MHSRGILVQLRLDILVVVDHLRDLRDVERSIRLGARPRLAWSGCCAIGISARGIFQGVSVAVESQAEVKLVARDAHALDGVNAVRDLCNLLAPMALLLEATYL